MKRISRARLRGKPLDDACKKAHTTTHEYGPADNRVFCYGLFDPETDEPLERCKICGAFVRNVPYREDQNEMGEEYPDYSVTWDEVKPLIEKKLEQHRRSCYDKIPFGLIERILEEVWDDLYAVKDGTIR